jgi:hypothetical protein
MDSIISRLHNRLSFRETFESDRIGSSARRISMRLVRLSLLGLVVVLTILSSDSQLEGANERGVTTVEEGFSSVDFGTYHALIIGINDYSKWPQLKFAEQDASAIRQILVTRYGFESGRVKYLSGSNATRSQILGGLRAKLESLGEHDNLLVYYAGHGQLDPLTENGYWIPVEGGLYDESSWIAFSTILTLLTGRGVEAKSIMVLTDSCYGGALARSGPTPGHRGPSAEDYQQYEQKLTKLASKRSRQIIASGGYEQVPDRSFFADLLKQALEENTHPMIDLEYLFFDRVFPKLKFIGQQEPTFARLVSGPEEDGQFVLLQTTVAQSEPPAVPIPQPEPKVDLTVRSNVYDDTVYIDGQAQGSTRLDLELAPGLHAVRVEKEGHLPYEQQVELRAGENVTVQAQLEPIKPKVAAAPVISFFDADPLQITSGQPTTLHWETQNAEIVEIAGIGRVPLSGSWPIEPSQTANYVLIATNEQGHTVKKEIRITVVIEAPRIVSFRASPSGITHGASSTLSWQTENARSVHIDGIGRVELSGSMRVRPSQTAAYTLIAENEQGANIKKEVTVAVSANPPRILSFETDHHTIKKGETSHLRWQVSDAAQVSINGKKVQSSGSMAVSPQQSSRYILTASNTEGERVEDKLAIRVVVPAPKIIRFEATSPITQGGSSTLSWKTLNTERVKISGVGGVSSSGTKRVAPKSTTTYTLIAMNDSGAQVRQTATVKVNPTPRKTRNLQGTYTIQQRSTGRYLDAHEGSNDNSVVTRNRQNNTTQAWILTPLGQNTYTIQQKSNRRYMDAHEGSNDNSVVTRNRQNNNTQRWIIKPL